MSQFSEAKYALDTAITAAEDAKSFLDDVEENIRSRIEEAIELAKSDAVGGIEDGVEDAIDAAFYNIP